MPIRRPTLRRRLATSIAATLLLAACGPGPTGAPSATSPAVTQTPATATPGPSAPPAAEVYSEIRKAVEAIRGLKPSADVDPVTIDESQLLANLTAEFDTENTKSDLQFSEETLIALGLLPTGSSLRDLTLGFQGSQVAGYYSPDRNELFVVSRSGALGPAEEVTYAHEYTHQLQDQNYDLSLFAEDTAHQGDRALAQLALVEGDAVSVQNRWTIASLTPEEMGQLLQASLDPKALEALRRAPAYLRETSLFPYLNGNPFVESLIATGGYAAVNDAFAKPPVSTEQILHPEKYANDESPVEILLPDDIAKSIGAHWSQVGRDTLGEYVLRLWLTQNGVSATVATNAAAGWGGDRIVLLRGPSGGLTVGLRSEWDTPREAAEFVSAADTAMKASGRDHSLHHAQGTMTVILAIGDAPGPVVIALGG